MVTDTTVKDLEKRSSLRDTKAGTGSKASLMPKTTSKSSLKDLSSFTKNASPAQIAQIRMIRKVFDEMDGDKDGVLSVDDVKQYFHSKGRRETDAFIRKWIANRDIDQDGAVSLVEFISSYTSVLDLGGGLAKGNPAQLDKGIQSVTSITLAFGALRAANHERDVIMVCDEVTDLISKIIATPQVAELRTIHTSEEKFHRYVGRIMNATKLLMAFGFRPENNGSLLTLRDESGRDYELVPPNVLKELKSKLEELNCHRQSLTELSISNVAAVSSALADPHGALKDWLVTLETCLLIVRNILEHPTETKYYKVNVLNKNFHERIGRKVGGINLLHAIGFRTDDENNLYLPLDFPYVNLEARKLEIEVAIQKLLRRIELAGKKSKEKDVGPKTLLPGGSPLKKAIKNDAPVKSESSNTLGKDNRAATPSAERKMAVVTPPSHEKVHTLRQQSLALETERKKRQRAEKLLQLQKANLNELQNKVEDLQAAEENRKGLEFEATVGPLFERVAKEGISKSAVVAAAVTKRTTDADATIKLRKKLQEAETVTTTFSPAGSTKLQVASAKGFKKGMYILIGEGARMELKKVAGFGSILIDLPTLYDHAMGTPVLALKNKGLTFSLIEKFIMVNCIQAIISDEIVSSACSIGESHRSARYERCKLRRQPLQRSRVVYSMQQPIASGFSSIFAAAMSNDLKNIYIASPNGLYACTYALSVLDLIAAYEACYISSGTDDEQPLRSQEDHGVPSELFWKLAHSSKQWMSIFSHTTPALSAFFTSGPISTRLPWDKYFRLVCPRTELMMNLEQYDLRILNIPREDVTLLSKVYNCYLLEGELNVYGDQIVEIFSALDGCLFHDTLSRILGTITGSASFDTIIDYPTFVTVRHKYAIEMGLSLSGQSLQQKINSIVDILSSTPNVICETSGLGNLSLHSRMLPDNVKVTCMKLDVQRSLLYLSDYDGIMHVFDATTHALLYRQRVLYAEPSPSITVEGSEKLGAFYRDTPERFLSLGGDLDPSSRLSRFLFDLPLQHSPKVFEIEPNTGLVIINSVAGANAICFHEPVSLRRLYRIKYPVKLTNRLQDAIRGVINNSAVPPALTASHCQGVLASFSVVMEKSCLVCHAFLHNTLFILNMYNGAVVTELDSHTHHITAISCQHKYGMILSGSEDGAIRVWNSKQCLPSTMTFDIAGDSEHAESKLICAIPKSIGAGDEVVQLAQIIQQVLSVSPCWQIGKVSAVLGAKGVKSGTRERPTDPVEIVFGDGRVKIFTNRIMLRNLHEVEKAPLGPPFWRQPAAHAVLGTVVAVYDFKASDMVESLAMLLKVHKTMPIKVSELSSALLNVPGVASSISLHILQAAFLCLGYSNSEFILLHDFLENIMRWNARVSYCSRLLLGHKAAIDMLVFMPSSNLVVSFDAAGVGCIWDLCVDAEKCQNGVIVNSQQVMVGMLNIGVIPIAAIVQSDPVVSSSFTFINTEMVRKAMNLDLAIVASGMYKTHIMLYIMDDFTYFYVEVFCFMPALLSLDLPLDFVHISSLVGDSLHVLQEIYRRKDKLQRIFYAVSRTHDQADDFVNTLVKYGVVHNAFTNLPSDQIEIIMFNRILLQAAATKGRKKVSHYALNTTHRVTNNTIGHETVMLLLGGHEHTDVRFVPLAVSRETDIISVSMTGLVCENQIQAQRQKLQVQRADYEMSMAICNLQAYRVAQSWKRSNWIVKESILSRLSDLSNSNIIYQMMRLSLGLSGTRICTVMFLLHLLLNMPILDNHPIMRYLEMHMQRICDVLCIPEAYRTKCDPAAAAKWRDVLENVLSAVLQVNNITIEDIFRASGNRLDSDIEHLSSVLTPNRLTPTWPFIVGDDLVNVVGQRIASASNMDVKRSMREVDIGDFSDALQQLTGQHSLKSGLHWFAHCHKLGKRVVFDMNSNKLKRVLDPLQQAIAITEKRAFFTDTMLAPDAVILGSIYNVVSRNDYTALFPGLKMQIIRGNTDVNSQLMVQEFMVWQYETDKSRELLHQQINKLRTTILRLPPGMPVLRPLDGIFFTGNYDEFCFMLPWNSKYISLGNLLDLNGGLWQMRKAPLIQQLASKIFVCLTALHDLGWNANCINPDTVFYDPMTSDVRIVLLPTITPNNVQTLDSAMVSLLTEYYAFSVSNLHLQSFMSPELRFVTSSTNLNSSDSWSAGIMTFNLAFGLLPALQMNSFLGGSNVTNSTISSLLECFCGNSSRVSDGSLVNMSATIHVSIMKLLGTVWEGTNLHRVKTLRDCYILEYLNCSVSQQTMYVLWEKLVFMIYKKVSYGGTIATKLDPKLPRTAASKLQTLPDTAKWIQEIFGIELRPKEIEALVVSADKACNKPSTLWQEKAVHVYELLNSLLEVFVDYAVLQQIIFCVLANLRTSASSDRLSPQMLLTLPLFSLASSRRNSTPDEEKLFSAELVVFNLNSFSQSNFLQPLSNAIHNLHWSIPLGVGVRSDIDAISQSLLKFGAVLESLIHETSSPPPSLGTTSKTNRLSLDIGEVMTTADASMLINSLISSHYIKTTTSYAIKLLQSDIGKHSSSTADNRRNLEIALGAKFLGRFLKFIEDILSQLNRAYSKVSRMKSVEDWKFHSICERLFNELLHSVMMLFQGKEHQLVQFGSNTSTAVVPNTVNAKFSVHIGKLIFPFLKNMVGEDASTSGVSKFGLDMLQASNNLLAVSTAARLNPTDSDNCHLMSWKDSTYFGTMMRMSKHYTSCVGCQNMKTATKAILGLLSFVALLIPSYKGDELMTEEERWYLRKTVAAAPNAVYQRCQAILDFHLSSKLQIWLVSLDQQIVGALLRICSRVFVFLNSLKDDLAATEPYLSLGKEFSSFSWINGLVQIVRKHSKNVSLSVSAVQCLRLMSISHVYTRCWRQSGVLQLLVSAANLYGRDQEKVRKEAQTALQQCVLMEYKSALTRNGLYKWASPNPSNYLDTLRGLSEEVKDLLFGSTIVEQHTYCLKLLRFLYSTIYPYVKSVQSSCANDGVAQEIAHELLSILESLAGNLPRVYVSFASLNPKEDIRGDKFTKFAFTLQLQLQIIDGILHAVMVDMKAPFVHASIVRSLWSSPSETMAARDVVQAQGLLVLLDAIQLPKTVAKALYHLKVLTAALHVLRGMLERADDALLETLHSMGVGGAVCKSVVLLLNITKEYAKTGTVGIYTDDCQTLAAALRTVWASLVHCRYAPFQNEIVDSGLVQQLCARYLLEQSTVPQSHADSLFHTHIVRYEALLLLSTLVFCPHLTPQLQRDIAYQCVHSSLVDRLVQELTRPSARDHQTRAQLTAHLLVLCARLDDQQINDEMMVSSFCGVVFGVCV
ncbi:hypothetical protein EON65_10585 [archaeon]|nr:MAG: hypothetical protein EON65_10585 [archaeon]